MTEIGTLGGSSLLAGVVTTIITGAGDAAIGAENAGAEVNDDD